MATKADAWAKGVAEEAVANIKHDESALLFVTGKDASNSLRPR